MTIVCIPVSSLHLVMVLLYIAYILLYVHMSRHDVICWYILVPPFFGVCRLFEAPNNTIFSFNAFSLCLYTCLFITVCCCLFVCLFFVLLTKAASMYCIALSLYHCRSDIFSGLLCMFSVQILINKVTLRFTTLCACVCVCLSSNTKSTYVFTGLEKHTVNFESALLAMLLYSIPGQKTTAPQIQVVMTNVIKWEIELNDYQW